MRNPKKRERVEKDASALDRLDKARTWKRIRDRENKEISDKLEVEKAIIFNQIKQAIDETRLDPKWSSLPPINSCPYEFSPQKNITIIVDIVEQPRRPKSGRTFPNSADS